MRKILRFLLLLILIACTAFSALCEVLVDGDTALTETCEVYYGEDYLDCESVALYLYAFGELPMNYLTKSEAQKLGWDSKKGNLWDVAYGCAIGGDRFGNREGLLPDARGRQWYECDVDYEGGFRGPYRILFSSDGMICYSGDHYKSYEILYDEMYNGGAQ